MKFLYQGVLAKGGGNFFCNDSAGCCGNDDNVLFKMQTADKVFSIREVSFGLGPRHLKHFQRSCLRDSHEKVTCCSCDSQNQTVLLHAN